jgi:hypothetical protein
MGGGERSTPALPAEDQLSITASATSTGPQAREPEKSER